MEELPDECICVIWEVFVLSRDPDCFNRLSISHMMHSIRHIIVRHVCQFLRFIAYKEAAGHIVVSKQPGDLCWITIIKRESCVSYPFANPAFLGTITGQIDLGHVLPTTTVCYQGHIMPAQLEKLRAYFHTLTETCEIKDNPTLRQLYMDLGKRYVVLNILRRTRNRISSFDRENPNQMELMIKDVSDVQFQVDEKLLELVSFHQSMYK